MIRSKKIKLFKWLSILGTTALVGALTIGTVEAIQTANATSNITNISPNKEDTSFNYARAIDNYHVKNNLFVNVVLNASLRDKYFDTITDWKLGTGSAILNAVIEEVKLPNNWYNSKVPSDLELELSKSNPIIASQYNPQLGVNAPAIKLSPTWSGSKQPEIIVSVLGLKVINGPTYPIDSVNNKLSIQDNITASFIYNKAPKSETEINGTKVPTAPTAEEIKTYLLTENVGSNGVKYRNINGIIANLPDIDKQQNLNDGNFTIAESDINVILDSAVPQITGQYNIFDYTISIGSYFTKSNDTLKIIKNSPISYDLKIYVPSIIQDQNILDSTAVNNVININSVENLPEGLSIPKEAYEFDQIRLNNNINFRKMVAALLTSNANMVNVPNDISLNEIEVSTVPALGNQKTINNEVGYAAYQVTIKRVKYNGEIVTDTEKWIRNTIIFTGFEQKHETLLSNTTSIANLAPFNTSLPSIYYNKPIKNGDILSEIASTSNHPTAYIGGSFRGDYSTTGDISSITTGTITNWDYYDAIFDDNTGSIRGINVEIQGLYDKNGISKNDIATKKTIKLNITGFRSQEVSGITKFDFTKAPIEYAEYPAQSFLIPDKDFEKLKQGFLPTTPDDITKTILTNKRNMLNDIISKSVINLPVIEGGANDPQHWEYKDIRINNFAGSIQGKVKFPYIYELSDNSTPVIFKQPEAPDAMNKEIWLDFTIDGFTPVESATQVTNNFTTNKLIYKDEWQSLNELPASNVLLDDYNPESAVPNKPESFFATNTETASYWANNTIEIFKNKWFSFEAQMKNSECGIRNLTDAKKDKQNNTYSFTFITNVFNDRGDFVPTEPITITIQNFGSDAPVQKPSIIQTYFPIQSPSEFQKYAASDIVAMLNDDPNSVLAQQKERFLSLISQTITTRLAQNIKNDVAPEYNFGRAELIPEKPGFITIPVSFKNNYFDAEGNFVDNSTPDLKVYNVQINGFNIIGDTALPGVLKVPEKFADKLPSEVVNVELNGPYETSNIKELQRMIIDNLYNPVGNDPNSGTYIPNEDVVSFITPTSASDIPPNSSYQIAANGKMFFGVVNDIEGEVTLRLQFNSGKYYEDSKLVNSGNKEVVVKLVGFNKISAERSQWYHPEVRIDTKYLVSSNGDDVASKLKEITSQSIDDKNSIYYRFLAKIWEVLFTDYGIDIKASINDWTKNFKMEIGADQIRTNNETGQAIVKLSLFGSKVFDPETGLVFDNPDNPFQFEVVVNGFISVKPTTYLKEINLASVSEITPPTAIEAIRNTFVIRENIKRLTNDTLPPGWWVDFESVAYNYLWIPDTTDDRLGKVPEPNISIDYAEGSLTIKQIVISYYFDKNFDLIKATTPFDEGFEWIKIGSIGVTPLILENVKITGYKKMKATSIIQEVRLNDLDKILATTYLTKNDGSRLTGQELVNKMIFTKNGSESEKVNNLSKFINNYDNSSIDRAPILSITDDSIVEDNINGSISFELVINANYLKATEKGLIFVKEGEPDTTPIKAVVVVKGFKQVKPSTINSNIDINNIYNSDDQLSEKFDPLKLFSYNAKFSDVLGVTPDDLNIRRLMSLVIYNTSAFINNPYNLENVGDIDNAMKKFFKVSNLSSDFKEGILSFDFELYSYVDQKGILHNNDTSNPLKQRVHMRGFKQESVTIPVQTDTNNNVIIDIRQFGILENLDYFCNVDDLKIALIKSATNDGKRSSLLDKVFKHIPPYDIFRFLTGDKPNFDGSQIDLSILNSSIDITLDPASEVGSEQPSRTGTMTLKNIMISEEILGTSQTRFVIGNKEFKFVLIGFDANVETKVMPEWNLSLYQSAKPNEFDITKLNKDGPNVELQEFFNKKIVINGIFKPLWTAFIRNPIYTEGGNDNTTLSFQVIESIPADGIVIVDLTYTNYYDQTGHKNKNSKTERVTISGFKVQSPTTIKETKIDLGPQLIKVLPKLPSEVKNEHLIDPIINILNEKGVIDTIFDSPYVDAAGPDNNTKIVSVNIVRVNDIEGSIDIELTYKNTYDANGSFSSEPIVSKEPITITGFNKLSVTGVSKQRISINEFYTEIPKVGTSNNKVPINQLLPSQVLKLIQQEMDEVGGNDSNVKLAIFLNNVINITNPVYNGIFDSTSLNWQPIISTQVNIPKIIRLGEIKNNQDSVVKTQEQTELKTRINLFPNQGVVTPENVLRPNDRLGFLTFTLEVTNIWQVKNTENGIEFYVSDASNGGQKPLSIDLQISGFMKDVATSSNLSSVAIIASSVGAGVVILIILIAFLIWLWKFGIGSH